MSSVASEQIRKQQLLKVYSTTVAHYRWALSLMRRQFGSLPDDELSKFKQMVDDSRSDFLEARNALRRLRAAR